MEVIEAIRTRRSIRSYTDEPVDDEMIESILDAGRWAPSARNKSDVSFVVVRDEEKRNDLTEWVPFGPFLAEAPVAIIVVADTSKGRWGVHNASAAIENMLLAAHALGLGSCWLGRMDGDAVRDAFGIPDHFAVITVLPIGHPAEEPSSSRAPLDELVHEGRW